MSMRKITTLFYLIACPFFTSLSAQDSTPTTILAGH